MLRWWRLPLGFAPASRRICTQSRCPLTTATYSAVWPFTSTRSTLAPWQIRKSTQSLWPAVAAMRSGVQGSQPQHHTDFSLIRLQKWEGMMPQVIHWNVQLIFTDFIQLWWYRDKYMSFGKTYLLCGFRLALHHRLKPSSSRRLFRVFRSPTWAELWRRMSSHWSAGWSQNCSCNHSFRFCPGWELFKKHCYAMAVVLDNLMWPDVTTRLNTRSNVALLQTQNLIDSWQYYIIWLHLNCVVNYRPC